MPKVTLDIGTGAHSFCLETDLPIVPRAGDEIAANGDSRVYEVERVTILRDGIIVVCRHRFASEAQARQAAKEWTGTP